MVLSVLPLNVKRETTIRAIRNPNIFHGAIEWCFDDGKRRKLWRIDTYENTGPCLLILSSNKQDLKSLERQFGFTGRSPSWIWRDLDETYAKIKTGDRLKFRFVANPVINKYTNYNLSVSKIQAITPVSEQKQWLLDRSEKNGFCLETGDFDAINTSWFRFRHDRKRVVTTMAVSFEGILTVTNENLFVKVLENGLGKGKAYGMGLMTVAPA